MDNHNDDTTPENNVGESRTRRTGPKTGRYEPPRPLGAWVLAAAAATLTDDGVLSAREIVRVLGLPSLPVKVDLFLLYEIPFAVAPRGARITFQIERPTGEDARDYLPKDARALFNSSAGIARRVTRLAGVPILEEGWHTIRIWNDARVLAETSILAMLGSQQRT